jgi:hypothetical protein
MMWRPLLYLLLLSLATGCSTIPPAQPSAAPDRPFDFRRDTFTFANELKWIYETDPATGKTVTREKHPPPAYSLHCFVLARSAKQFFQHVRFDPHLPGTNDATYISIVRKIARSNSRSRSSSTEQIVVPGYSDLRQFSREKEPILKSHLGGAWRSYFQRGNWRMIFPFRRAHQQRTAEQLRVLVGAGTPTVVHIVRFPGLQINHALLLFDFESSKTGTDFIVYDPNTPDHEILLHYNETSRTFFFPANTYFSGGRVDVYPVYINTLY